MTGPRITVITPTHNRRDSIRRTMEALAAQTTGPDLFEAIVVADGCRDDTVQLLRSLTLPFPLTVLELPGNGAATARNTGVSRARGEILVCIDDDIEPVPEMLGAYLRAHERHPDHLIIGHCPPVLQAERSLFHMELRNWWQDHILGMRQQGHRFDYRDMHAGNFSIAREVYLSVNGFDQAFPGCGGEDYEFGARLLQRGVPFAFAHDALGWHHEASDLERSLKRARQEGRADVLIGMRHPELRAGLPLARFRSPRSKLQRVFRNLAFNRSPTGERALAPLRRLLGPLEWGHLRRRWRGVYGLVRSYWYCRGVADELGSLEALEQFLAGRPEDAPLADLDISTGLASAQERLDETRPQGVWVHFGDTDLGVIPPVPGAEPVRGAHLAAHLAGPVAPRLLTAIALDDTRATGAWERFFGAPETATSARDQARMNLAALAAGSAIAAGRDLTSALSIIQGATNPIVNPVEVTENLMTGWNGKRSVAENDEIFQAATDFLEEAERITGTPTLARRTSNSLARRIINQSPVMPVRLGQTTGQEIDITEPLGDVPVAPGIERLHCRVTAGKTTIGNLQLPVIAGRVSGEVLADAIAARWGWRILGEFFGQTVYPKPLPENHHIDLGWETFLRQFWGQPDWPASRFYEDHDAGTANPGRTVEEKRTRIEASDEIPDLLSTTGIDVELTVGGTPIAVLSMVPDNGRISNGRIRNAFTRSLALELVTTAVREGLLGSSWGQSPSLRERLRERSRHPALQGADRVLPRWSGSPAHASLGRRAEFPPEAMAAVELLAKESGVPLAGSLSQSGILRYAPALIVRGETETQDTEAAPQRTVAYDRHYFEALFAGRPDPWSYGTPYEVLKYRQTLDLIPDRPGLRALEVACAEGHFTELLAQRVDDLVAADISTVALERAANRLSGNDRVRFLQLDLFKEPIPGRYDVIVCSEVLYFAGSRELLEITAAKLAAALEPGGHLVLAHANVLADSEDGLGLDWAVPFGARTIGETFAGVPELRFLRELKAEGYRIQLFRREDVSRVNRVIPEPETVTMIPQGEATPHLAAAFIPAGSKGSDRPRPPVTTSRLPILMYHRVADESRAARHGFQVSRRSFAQQMDYLARAGFYTIDLATWALTVSQRRSLPGRALVLTFDDGYQDFADHAWPVLRQHGFGAMVMLITEAVGGNYHWDFAASAPAPLMGWDVIRELGRSGVTFGSHTTSHRPLTGLSPAEIVREAAESRAVLTRELAQPVDTIAYPYGDCDAVVRHFMGPLGYSFGLTTWQGRNGFNDSLLSLRRIEVSGFDSLDRFIARLGD